MIRQICMRDTETLVSQLNPNPLVQKAYQFARKAHREQLRSDNTELVINHPLRVALMVQSAQSDAYELICAALLHDTVEDTGTSIETISSEFGVTISNIVLGLTKNLSVADYNEQQTEYHNRLSQLSPPTLLIKCADAIDNTESIIHYAAEHDNKFPWSIFSNPRAAMITRWHKLLQLFESKLAKNELLNRLKKDLQTVENIF